VNIDTYHMRSQVEALLRDVGLGECELLIVDSVHDWAEDNGRPRVSPFLAALAATRSDGVPFIVLHRCITEDVRASVISGMNLRGFAEEAEQLKEPSAFLEHLILHEAAHLLLPTGTSEDDCDRWAFERLTGRIQ